jgi:opacity protein-like surface antigen
MKFATALILIGLLCCLAAGPILAQSDLGFKGVGGEIGLVSPQDVDTTVGFGLFTDLGFVAPRFQLEGFLDYWSQTEVSTAGSEVSVRDLAFGMRGKYIFPNQNPGLRPFAGFGLGLHFLNAEISIADIDYGGVFIPGETFSDSTTRLGLDLGGGVAAALSDKTDFIGEMWYGIVDDFNQLSIKAGILYKLGM